MKKRMEFLRFFLRGLSGLLEAGIPILKGLYSLREQAGDLQTQALIERVIVRISSGETLSFALKKERKFFPKFVVSLVYLGEETAHLPENLLRAAEFVETSMDFKTKIYSALTYPAFLVGVMFFGLVVLLKYFIPTFAPVFFDSRLSLPSSTRFLLSTSRVFGSPWFWLGGLVLAANAVYLYVWIVRDDERRHRLDQLLLWLPGVGKVLKSGLFAQLTRTLSTAYSAGLSIGRALSLLEETVENEVFRRFIQDSQLAIAEGKDLSEYFLSQKRFAPPLVGHLLAVGEKTGKMGSLLPKCTRMLEEDTEFFLQQFFKFLEPGILTIMGILVTFVCVSVFSPLYGMLAAVAK